MLDRETLGIGCIIGFMLSVLIRSLIIYDGSVTPDKS